MGVKRTQKGILLGCVLLVFITSVFAGELSAETQETTESTRATVGDVEEQSEITLEVKPEVKQDAGASEKMREARKARELVEINVQSLPQVKIIAARPLAPLPQEKESPVEERTTQLRKITSSSLQATACHNGKTEYLPAATFGCEDGISQLDTKETPLYTGSGKHYAFIETTFTIPQPNKKTMLRLMHDTQFPTQQDASIYYFNPETSTWKLACHSIKEGTSFCDVTPVATSKKATFRVEGYAREGPARWSVNNVALFQENQVSKRTPQPSDAGAETTIDPLDPACTDPSCDAPLPGDPTCTGPLCDPPSPPAPAGPPPATLAVGHPLAKTPGTPGPVASTSSSPATSTQTENTQPLQGNQPEPSPITGAAIGNFLTQNKVGFGLLLLFIGIVGTMAYRSSRRHHT